MKATAKDYLKMAALYALPHHLISRVVYFLTRIRSPLVPFAIQTFSKVFKVNLSEAEISNPDQFGTFNEFFTRKLKRDSRPIASSDLVSPVDGTISAFGNIENGQLFQAKGINYRLQALLGDNERRTSKYLNGQFITIYLSPKDYHRIHMPCSGKLIEHTHVPGRLFSVANHTVNTLKGLFARNERLIASFDTEFGPMAMVLVGAINVAAIETVWAGLITPPKGCTVTSRSYRHTKIHLSKGEEMGRFNMGSTVILLFSNSFPDLDKKLEIGQSLRLGDQLVD